MQPVQLHGSFGRDAATGRGTVFATRELLKASGQGSLKGKEFVIQVSLLLLTCKLLTSNALAPLPFVHLLAPLH